MYAICCLDKNYGYALGVWVPVDCVRPMCFNGVITMVATVIIDGYSDGKGTTAGGLDKARAATRGPVVTRGVSVDYVVWWSNGPVVLRRDRLHD
jgi:hypothetical protein